ncbi:MAG: nucleoside-triphosphatase [Bacteroidales bacterium]|nr:nucleoside-triphosphatase [Bacteroidales bacterium]
MITIVTGPENSGKSSFLENWFDQSEQGVGAISVKRYKRGVFSGYNLMQLPDKELIPLNCLVKENDQIGPESLICGHFIFYPASFVWLEDRLQPYVRETSDCPVWLDEIGKLELQRKGFDSVLRKALRSNCELRFAVRENLLDDILDEYGIQDPKIIRL